MSLHKLDEEHGAGARPGHLACAEIKLSRRGSATQCWLISAQLCTLVYRVRVEDEASPAFSGHRDDVVILADILANWEFHPKRRCQCRPVLPVQKNTTCLRSVLSSLARR